MTNFAAVFTNDLVHDLHNFTSILVNEYQIRTVKPTIPNSSSIFLWRSSNEASFSDSNILPRSSSVDIPLIYS